MIKVTLEEHDNTIIAIKLTIAVWRTAIQIYIQINTTGNKLSTYMFTYHNF